MICDSNNCNIYDAGCVPTCGNYTFVDIIIPDAGNYFVVYDHNGVQVKNAFTIAVDEDPVILNLEKYPVNKEILFQIINSSGENIEWTFESVIYQYFRIKLTVGMEAEESELPVNVGAWHQVIQGDGTDEFTTTNPIYSFDIIQVFRDGVLCRPDVNLSEVNTYKLVAGNIILSHDLLSDSFLHIYKF